MKKSLANMIFQVFDDETLPKMRPCILLGGASDFSLLLQKLSRALYESHMDNHLLIDHLSGVTPFKKIIIYSYDGPLLKMSST